METNEVGELTGVLAIFRCAFTCFSVSKGVFLGRQPFSPLQRIVLCSVCFNTFIPETFKFDRISLLVILGLLQMKRIMLLTHLVEIFPFIPQSTRLSTVLNYMNFFYNALYCRRRNIKLPRYCFISWGKHFFGGIYNFVSEIITKLFFLCHLQTLSKISAFP